jgi:hypothetical protein
VSRDQMAPAPLGVFHEANGSQTFAVGWAHHPHKQASRHRRKHIPPSGPRKNTPQQQSWDTRASYRARHRERGTGWVTPPWVFLWRKKLRLEFAKLYRQVFPRTVRRV